MGRKNGSKKGKGNNSRRSFNVWRSYSDMMAGLLLVFILVMAVSFIEAQRSYESEMESQKLSEELNQQVAAQKKEVEKQKKALEEQQKILEEQTNSLKEKEDLVNKQKSILEEQSKILEEQSNALETQQKVMVDQQKKIDNIIGIKAELITELKSEFEKKELEVKIDEKTGAISFDSNVLFDYNKSVLTLEGQKMLKTMLPVYCQILLSDKYKGYLSEVIVDGFTDTKGTYLYNLKLSQERAYAVSEYLLTIDKDFLTDKQADLLEEKLTTNGRSKSNPIITKDNKVDMDASRRVEMKFRLKDEDMINELLSIMEKENVSV